MPDEPKYLWVVTLTIGRAMPAVERYEVVKMNPGGGATVKRYGGLFILRKAQGRTIFTDEQKMWEFVRLQVQHNLSNAQRDVDKLTATFAKLAAGDKTAVFVEEVQATPIVKGGKLKLD